MTQDAKDNFDQWIYKNGLRWVSEGGPLAAGGVDIAFIGKIFQLLRFSDLTRTDCQMILRCQALFL